MTQKDSEPQFCDVLIYSDNKTPFQFVAGLIKHVTGTNFYDAEEYARRIHRVGQHAFGPYPESIAAAMVEEANRLIREAGHPLKIEAINPSKPDQSEIVICAFCGKSSTAVAKMFTGAKASICSECVVRGAGALQELIPSARVTYNDANQLNRKPNNHVVFLF